MRTPDLEHLLVEHVQQRLSGKVGHEECALPPLPSKGARAETPLLIAVENHPHVLHIDDFLARLHAHDRNRVLVAEVVAALDGVVGVLFPVIAAVSERGVDAALGGVGVAANRVHLGHHSYVRAVFARRESGPHPCQTGAYNQHVVVEHRSLWA